MKKKPLHIFVDFDGTITTRDSLQAVLDHFTGTEWRKIEDKVTAGELSEKLSLQMEFDLLKATPDEVIQFIEKEISIDESFIPFMNFCRKKNIPVTILSGGLIPFIKIILEKYSLADVPVYANNFRYNGQKWEILPNSLPKIKNRCNHCKTYHLYQARQNTGMIIYIGDGNTDRCPAQHADLVFAKGSLASFLESQNKPYISFDSFESILKELEGICFNWSALMTV